MKELIVITFGGGGKIINEAEAFSVKEFHSRLSEEKPPNKRTGMRGDVRSIRMFNQEGRLFSFAGERRRKGQAVGRSGIVTL